MDDPAEAARLIDGHVAALLEHFETVQIFVTKVHKEADATASMVRGDGNWFARYGQVKEWILKTEAMARREIPRPPRESDE